MQEVDEESLCTLGVNPIKQTGYSQMMVSKENVYVWVNIYMYIFMGNNYCEVVKSFDRSLKKVARF